MKKFIAIAATLMCSSFVVQASENMEAAQAYLYHLENNVTYFNDTFVIDGSDYSIERERISVPINKSSDYRFKNLIISGDLVDIDNDNTYELIILKYNDGLIVEVIDFENGQAVVKSSAKLGDYGYLGDTATIGYIGVADNTLGILDSKETHDMGETYSYSLDAYDLTSGNKIQNNSDYLTWETWAALDANGYPDFENLETTYSLTKSGQRQQLSETEFNQHKQGYEKYITNSYFAIDQWGYGNDITYSITAKHTPEEFFDLLFSTATEPLTDIDISSEDISTLVNALYSNLLHVDDNIYYDALTFDVQDLLNFAVYRIPNAYFLEEYSLGQEGDWKYYAKTSKENLNDFVYDILGTTLEIPNGEYTAYEIGFDGSPTNEVEIIVDDEGVHLEYRDFYDISFMMPINVAITQQTNLENDNYIFNITTFETAYYSGVSNYHNNFNGYKMLAKKETIEDGTDKYIPLLIKSTDITDEEIQKYLPPEEPEVATEEPEPVATPTVQNEPEQEETPTPVSTQTEETSSNTTIIVLVVLAVLLVAGGTMFAKKSKE
ncbi:MAG: hypothetical protein ATN35_04625 [Epulopiscium sp. Nele67-Bin004]|nr:MAG: hypothetical protein ATN35_04625 [Epulopiscium sp. Nele67-Bin004]